MTQNTSDEILYYHLQPVRRSDDQPGQIVTAACVQCIATGRILDGMGGPGYALSPEIVRALDMQEAGDGSKAIVDANDLDRAALHLSNYADGLRTQRDMLRANKLLVDPDGSDPLSRIVTEIDDLAQKFRREES